MKLHVSILLCLLCIGTYAQKSLEPNNQDSICNHYIDIAEEYLQNDSLTESITYLNKVLAIQPKSLIAIGLRGVCYSFQPKLLDSAIIDFTAAISLDSSVMFSFQKRAEVYYDMKRFDECIKDLNVIIKTDSLNVKSIYSRALAYTKLNQRDKSIQDYLKIIEIDTKQLTATDFIITVYNNLGFSYLEMGNYAKARFFIDRAILSGDNLSYIWGSSGILNYKQGLYNQALIDLEKGIAILENGEPKGLNFQPDLLYYYRGLVLLKQHKNTESRKSLKKALELGNKDAKAQLAKTFN
jgi:tetratricopeptide (TPR) repeat protein